jgi:hypothetical protein
MVCRRQQEEISKLEQRHNYNGYSFNRPGIPSGRAAEEAGILFVAVHFSFEFYFKILNL